MDKEAMKVLILESLTQKLGSDYYSIIEKVLKTNQKLDCLYIYHDGDNISPAIYLDPFYKKLEDGAKLDDVTDSILQSYFQFQDQKCSLPFDTEAFFDFENIKNNLYVVLINKHLNTELLQSVPHSLFLDDFAVTVRVLIEESDHATSSFMIHNRHIDAWNIDHDTLLRLALQNTRKLFGLDLMSLNEVLNKMGLLPPMDDISLPIWVMTNNRKMYGAATVLFDDVLKSFANTHGSFYLVFSSVHEILLIPETEGMNIDLITAMNRKVNASEIREEEILGTKAYYYDKEKGFC